MTLTSGLGIRSKWNLARFGAAWLVLVPWLFVFAQDDSLNTVGDSLVEDTATAAALHGLDSSSRDKRDSLAVSARSGDSTGLGPADTLAAKEPASPLSDSTMMGASPFAGDSGLFDTTRAVLPSDSGKEEFPVPLDSLTDYGKFIAPYTEQAGGFLFTREQIARSDATTLAELLAALPGFAVYRNAFWAGAEEIRWHGMQFRSVTLTVNGVPYSTQDLHWQELPRLSPSSFDEVRVSFGGEKHGGRPLLIELVGLDGDVPNPVTEAVYQTGPFGTSLLDVVFSRKLSRTLGFSFHTRTFATQNTAYRHPDVITTFYESLGKDSAAISREGTNPMQRYREYRVALQQRLGSQLSVHGSYITVNEDDSLFLLDTSDGEFKWLPVSSSHGEGALGIRGLVTPAGSFALLAALQKGQTCYRIVDTLPLPLEAWLGVEKPVSNGEDDDPLRIWLENRVDRDWIRLSGLQSVQVGEGRSVKGFGLRERVRVAYWLPFVEAWGGYGVYPPQSRATFMGLPVRIPSVDDTVFDFGVRGGLHWGGWEVWSQHAEYHSSSWPYLLLDSAITIETSKSQSFGIGRNGPFRLQFGTQHTFGNAWPYQEHRAWIRWMEKAMDGKLGVDGLLEYRYISELMVPDIAAGEWKELELQRDLALKWTIQIRRFRLFFKADNLLNDRRQFFGVPYELPGLRFLWGIRWLLQG